MKIQVFGSSGCCAPCKKMLSNVETAVAELGIAEPVEYVDRIQQMIELGISSSPALVVNGKVKCVGKALDPASIKAILAEEESEASK